METDLVDRVETEMKYLHQAGRYRLHFDRERMDPSVAIVAMVAAVTETSPLDVDPPLTDIVDPDAIDMLFESRQDDGSESSVVFYLDGCQVHLFADDRVEVVPPE